MRVFQKQIPNVGLVAYKERLVLGNVRLHCTGKKSEIKTLGVVVDDQLLWKNHVDATIAKVSKGIGMLRRMKPYVPKFTLMHVYNALILPHFDYSVALSGIHAVII